MQQTILIIGAGAAGLMAARELSKKNKVIIIEARNRLGGRLHTIHAGDTIIEAGAEFVHGQPPVTLQLIREAKLEKFTVKGKFYRTENGKWQKMDEFIEGWDSLIEKMGQVDPDTTLSSFLQQYYADDSKAALRKHAIAFTEGFDVADPNTVSVQSLYKEWSKTEEDNSRIKGGYIKLVEYLQRECLANGCIIHTSEIVKEVNWQEKSVSVQTLSGQTFQGDKLITTVPVSLLQENIAYHFINFNPSINDYIKAATEIGFGTVIKVVFLFKQSFWQKDAGFILSDQMVPTWWTQSPGNPTLLTGWAGGPAAEKMSDWTDAEIKQQALESLQQIFDLTFEAIEQNLEQSWIFNWKKTEESLGAYSYATPLSAAARQVLNKPILDTLFFAGESVHEGDYPGTAEAAFASGKEIAALINTPT